MCLFLRRKYLRPSFLCSCLLRLVTVAMDDLLKLKRSRGGVRAAVTRNVNRAKDIVEIELMCADESVIETDIYAEVHGASDVTLK